VAIVFTEWYNANEHRRYPIHDRATGRALSGALLPDNLIVDANIWVPRSAGAVIFISSVGISNSLVSVTFAAAQADAFSGTSSSSSAAADFFVPIASVALVKPLTKYVNVKLDPIYPGVGGWISFGSGVDGVSGSYLFSGAEATQLLDRVVRLYKDIPVKSIGRTTVPTALTGLVRLRGINNVVTRKDSRTINGVTRDVALIGLDVSEDGVAKLQEFSGVCGHRPQVGTCNTQPITEINGVVPDCDGNISLVFEGDVRVGDTGDGIVLDLPVGLSEVCGPSPFDSLPLEADDVCAEAPPSSSSSSESPTPSQSSSSLSEQSGLPSAYCEDFEGAIEELSVIRGVFTVQMGGGANTNRYVSQAGNLLDQLAIDVYRPMRVLNTGDSYLVDATVRPRSGSSGEGHLIVGYRSVNDFFFAGFTLRPYPSPYAGGMFFIGQKSAVGPSYPNALGQGYNFIAGAQFVPPAPLVVADFRLHFQVVNIGSNLINLQLYATWNDGTARQLLASANVPSFSFNLEGYVGFGVVGAETEFDDFGINCEESSSSFEI